ncbi:MAG: hypothetical protein QM844_15885, partial [Planctomycetota bacterium]|nr:hypothetical protein [Planctomycetota bacterium]
AGRRQEEAMKKTEAQVGVGTLHQFVRPHTRGELARRLKAGETCEVASHVEAITTVMLCHWLDCTNFTVEPSHNRGWHIYRPNTVVHQHSSAQHRQPQ